MLFRKATIGIQWPWENSIPLKKIRMGNQLERQTKTKVGGDYVYKSMDEFCGKRKLDHGR